MPQYFYIDIILALTFMAPLAAVLVYFNAWNIRAKLRKELIGWAGMISVLCLVAYILTYSKCDAKFQDWFFEGQLRTEEVLVEGEESGEYYADRHYFDFANEPELNAMGGVTFLLLMGVIGGVAIGYYTYTHSLEEKKPTDRRERRETFLIVIKLVLATGLILCLLDLPYVYYNILRWVMAIACFNLASDQHEKNHFGGWFFFVATAILFNPLYEVHLTRLLWNVIDIMIAVVLLAWATKEYVDRR